MEEEEKEDSPLSGSFEKEEDLGIMLDEEVKGGESEKNIDDIPEFFTPEEEKEGKYFHKNQDYLIPEQLYTYCQRLTTSAEINQIMKTVPQIDEIEKKVAMIISSNSTTQLKK
jgi:hypothetical protein